MDLQPLFIRDWKQLSAYDWCFENQSKNGEILDRTSIGLIIDKMFADILDVH